ncbi:MAG: GNAT family N-acetyltransferase [Planctomycetes bacterium]|nr:GNAT family N-acetyltransferase [Planctomycetota bacterium]
MTSSKIRLEPFESADAARLCAWIDSPRLLLQWSGQTFRLPFDVEQMAAHLHKSQTSGGAHQILRARETASGRVFGHVELVAIDRLHGNCRIGRVLIGPPDKRGQGLGKQLMAELLRMGFLELGLHRMELEVYDFNRVAIRCYESLGFRREGVRRECVRLGDEFWNSIWMAVLRREWNGAHSAGAAHERRAE